MANVSPKIVLGMLFITLSGADVDFLDRELRWRTYITEEALPTTRRVELVGKKEFAAAELDPEHESYVVHVGSVGFDASPSSSPGSYKGPRRVYRLCVLSGLGFRTSRAY